MNDQLEKRILHCELCLNYLQAKCNSKPTKTLGQEIPVHPGSNLATDIFHFEGAEYLLIVDYTSRFLIVCKLTSMTGKHVANQCRSVFSQYGWSDTLISDNGPCYTSQEFTCVMQTFSVNHSTSSPHYPQSNGPVEKYVQIVKCLFHEAKEEAKDFHKCLMIYHNTPHTGSLQMPMQILQGRSARSDLLMSFAQMQLEISLDSSQRFKGRLISMKNCLHMIYTLDNM